MEKKVLDWLLAGPAWLRYAVELQLLGSKPDVTPVLQDVSIKKILERLKGATAGIPALKSGRVHYTEAGKAYWDLFFLADIGLSIKDLGLEKEAEEIFRFQSPDGSFAIPPNVRDNYFCMSAILLASLAKMGYRDDPPAGKVRMPGHELAVLRWRLALLRRRLRQGGDRVLPDGQLEYTNAARAIRAVPPIPGT